MKKSLVIVFVICCFGFSIAQRPIRSDEYEVRKPKQILKISRLGTRDAALVCLDGGDPAGYKKGGVLIISCGYADDISKDKK